MKSNFAFATSVKIPFWLLFLLSTCLFTLSCNNDANKPREKDIVKEQELFPERLTKNLTTLITYASENNGKINDSTTISSLNLVKTVYNNNNFTTLWSTDGKWNSIADSLHNFVKKAMEYGLFPIDYHAGELNAIQQRVQTDTLAEKDAALWSRADVLMTDALLQISADLKRGRLPYDSLSRKDTAKNFDSIYLNTLSKVTETKTVKSVLNELEPQLPGYTALRSSIRNFLDSNDFRKFTYLQYPYKDSIQFFEQLQQRLFEEKLFDSLPTTADTAFLRKNILKYQAIKKLKTSGRINEATVRNLNDTNWERYKRIAVTLDKYRLMADTMPTTYVWVNIPSFYLKVMDSDTVAMDSKVIVGATATRTPELHSDISNFITYPQWTVPYSIVFKEMLPAIQRDVAYLDKQNLMVVDKNDSVLDPYSIKWEKLSKKRFPYQIRQREGDDNSLGVLKFNFRNKYAVYLHDTNARWMFAKTGRALSHGCVRVQDWRDLAHFLVRNDTIKYSTDTLASWIVRQEKHVVSGFKKVPLFIRYFTCEGSDGRVKFYDDIYGEDKILTERYFSKYIN